jgi:signal transduction histidine kinase
MYLAVGASQLQVFVYDPAETNCASLVDATVRLRGVVTSRFNQQRQWLGARLNVTTLTNVFVEHPPRLDPFDSPLFRISTLAKTESARAGTEFSCGHRIKVRGVVTYFIPGERLFIQEGESGLEVQTRETEPLRTGEQIEVVGFPATGVYAPLLEDALYREAGNPTNIRPKPATASQILNGQFEAELVTVRARLLSLMTHQGDHFLVLQADNLLFGALLGARSREEPRLAKVPENSQVQLTGICQTVEATERMGVDSPVLSPTSVRLLLRSSQDLIVLREPSWWTPGRLIMALAGTGTLGLAAGCWIWLLQRRVRKQTAIILEKAQRETVLEERGRIARELHDTVEQELAGVTMQLDLVDFKLKQSPESSAPALALARRMARHCQMEARRSIWDLRCVALETGDLVSALEETVKPIITEHEVTLRLEARGKARRLPPAVENDILRVGQEAVTNAIKHAKAHQISVALEFESAVVQMTISDDGRGFNPGDPSFVLSGHFGLAGMSERAAKLGGRLTVDSAPGSGTRIRLVVPIAESLQRDA